LGADVVEIVLFSDTKFWEVHQDGLGKYHDQGGIVVAMNNHYLGTDHPWLRVMRRKPRGLGEGDVLAMNSSTGAGAINLALTLGCHRIFLLGFDMEQEEGRNNWHDLSVFNTVASKYDEFRGGMARLASLVKEKHPDRMVVNLNRGGRLKAFPQMTVEDHFGLPTEPRSANHD